MEDIVVYGTGGFGREVMDALEKQNHVCKKYHILGFIDDDSTCSDTIINGYKVVGAREYLEKRIEKINVLVCIGNPKIREKIVVDLKKIKNIKFPNFIADGVKLSTEWISMGEGNIIYYGNIVNVNVKIENFVYLNSASTIGHDGWIGDFVTVASGCNISGNVKLGKGCDIGTGSMIRQGIEIGENTVIGMGSVVVKDMPENVVAFGNPCEVYEK